MANPYTQPTLSGYNSSPPPDDGTLVPSNEIKWATHTGKLGDPLKTFSEAIDTNVSAAFDTVFKATENVFNDAQADINFRVESNNNADAIFVDAGNDRVGIFTAAPAVALDLTGALTTSGIVSVDDTTDTSSTTTGSVHTDGGLGVAKALWVGTTSRLVGAVTADAVVSLDDTTDTTSTTTGSLHTDGGIGIAKDVWVGAQLNVLGGGPHSIGAIPIGRWGIRLGGSIVSDGSAQSAYGVGYDGTITGASGDTALLAGMSINGNVVTQTATENITHIASLAVSEPQITDNLTGDITTATTLFVSNAPTEGETNYALWVDSGLTRFDGNCEIGSNFFVGETSNTSMTGPGITINQGAADDEAFALKSSDVAHGMTSLTETDTYGVLKKYQATSGGVALIGYKDADGDASFAVGLLGRLGEAADTGKTNSAFGVVNIDGTIKTGTTNTTIGADGNILSVGSNGSTAFIFDVEGSAHADVEWVAFDDFDDMALLNAMDMEFSRRNGDPIKEEFGEFLAENKAILQREKIVNFYDDGPRAMVNMTRLSMLHTGALRQMNERFSALESKLNRLENNHA